MYVTRWTNHGAPRGRREEWSWLALLHGDLFRAPQVVAKGSERAGWAPTTFVGDHRKEANVEWVYGLGFDVDACETIASVVDLFRGVLGVVHTTWSHLRPKYRPDGTELDAARPRCRVIVALSRPVTGEECRRLWPVVASLLDVPGVKVDEAAKDPSRLWYVPSIAERDSVYELHQLEGEALDVDQVLSDLDAEGDVERRARAYIAHRPGAVQGQGGSKVTYQVAVDLVRGFALPTDVALRVMETDYNPRCTPAWTRAELEHKVSDASKARAELGYLLGGGASIAATQGDLPGIAGEKGGAPIAGLDLWSAEDMAEEPPPTAYLVPRIHLAPGRPFALTGYAGAGKTFLLIDLLLAIARQGMSAEARQGVDEKCWGALDVTGGGVVHLDLEVGKKGIWQRYKRMARGRGFEVEELGRSLLWRSYPAFRLNQADALAQLCRMMEGRAVIGMDSLKALLPGVPENDSAIADYCGLLGQASDRTGCAVVLLHHEGKPGQDGPAAAQYRGRGSSAIQGCLSAQWSVSRKGGTDPGAGFFLLEQGKSEHDELVAPLRVKLSGSEERGDDGKSVRLWIAGVEEPSRTELEQQRDALSAERTDFLTRSVLAQLRLWHTIPDWKERGGCPGLLPMSKLVRCGQDALRPIWHDLSKGPLDSDGKRDSSKAVIENRGHNAKAAWRLKMDGAS